MELSGKHILILAGPDFEDRELFYPFYRLQEAGATVRIAGIGEKTYKGKYGISVDVDGQCDEYVGKHFDLVLIPGGWAPDKIRGNEMALDIVRRASREAAVAAICHAGWVLASADVVGGKTVTSYVNIKDDLINAGAKWVDQEVVVDGNLITSRKPDDLPAFCREIIKLLASTKVPA